MRRIVLSVLALSLFTGCVVSEATTKEVAEKQGFSDVEVGGADFFACSEDDLTGRSFTATNANGRRVEGTVCCGLFKSCTVRF